MQGDMSKASAPERFVPEELHEASDSTELVEVLPDVASQLVRHSLPEPQATGRSRKFRTTGRTLALKLVRYLRLRSQNIV